MDSNNILIGAIAGAVVGAIAGACLRSGQGQELVNSATRGIKDVSRRVTQYAKENMPGRNKGMESTSYQTGSTY